ncbi:MAG: deoxynucleoside kinase [Coprothermobacterota bacterium]|jgi:deoxyadenosine/deoxycytidine kinase|nr:deoxynucleoside kinase [Coprothermobacterota bacterium]
MKPLPPPAPFVAIAGNISVGKSTLCEILAARWGWVLFKEPEMTNPYLADYYLEPSRWGIHSQMHFLLERYQGHLRLQQRETPALLDRTIYEDAEVFAYSILDARDWNTYRRFYHLALRLLSQPRLVVYLRAKPETLLGRMRLRGRRYEQSVSLSYLSGLNRRYEEWAGRFRRAPLLTIETEDLDFVRSSADLERVVEQVEDALHRQESFSLFEAEEERKVRRSLW